MKRFAFLFFLCISFSTFASDIIAIVALDTRAHGISKGVKKNMRLIQKELRLISSITHMSLKETILHGKDLTAKSIQDALAKANPKEDDVILFYYSGHGFKQSQNRGHPYPTMVLSHKNQGVDFYETAQALFRKSNRLTIAVADCCNSDLRQQTRGPTYMPILVHDESKRINQQNLRSLFSTRGKYIVASAAAGENAWISHQCGGIFLNAFFDTIRDGDTTWDKVLTTTKQKVSEATRVGSRKSLQTPVFEKIRT